MNTDFPWLLCIHHIPPKPAYLRAKVAKRLMGLGAVALKNAVYILPNSAQHREDLGWLAKEIEDGGGKAFVVGAHFILGMDDPQVRALFQAAREAEYAAIVDQVRTLMHGFDDMDDQTARAELASVRMQAEAVHRIDFFGAPSRDTLDGFLNNIEARLAERSERGVLAHGVVAQAAEEFCGKTWVTRAGVFVDRISSAWLIRRFIDPEAIFRFVTTSTHTPDTGEATFDMQHADFGHEGDRCTFETFIIRLGMHDPALFILGEMVHDIDLKEDRFVHPETRGLAIALAGVALQHADDMDRIAAGSVVLDAMYEALRLGNKGNGPPNGNGAAS